MGIGILQPRGGVHTPVTGTKLFDEVSGLGTDEEAVGLKRHPKHHDIILQPQPSDDPNDPLNWSRLRKELFFASIILCTSAMGVVGPLFIPAFSSMAEELDASIAGIAQLNGILVMMLGITSFVGIAFGRIFGKRPFLVLTLLLEIAGLAWGANAWSYWSVYGARVVQGLGIGGFACMGNALVADVFFLHEQGTRIALWQLAWVVSVNVTPLISARIITAAGWRNAFYAVLGFACFCAIFFFLAAPESTFIRREISGETPIATEQASNSKEEVAGTTPTVVSEVAAPSRRSPLSVWNGLMTNESIWMAIARPFAVALTPPVFWCMITYGLLFSCTIIVGATYSQIFAAPPYSLDTNTVGNISGLGPLLGSLIALLSSGPIADFTARALSRRNDGYFEPEMYLVLMVPCSVFSLVGLVGWGVSVDRVDPSIVPAAMIALTTLGLSFGFAGTILYSSAVFPARQGDSFGIMMLFKSAITFGFLYFSTDWLVERGPRSFFCTWGGVCCGVSLLALPFYVYGKRIREWTSQSALLGWTTR